jgi:DNA polymerase I-like protein with 3'-5' exonuclease and polymerase domains
MITNNQVDLHKAKAAELFGISVDEVTSAQRQHAKLVYFALNYSTPLTSNLTKLKELKL